MFKRTITSLAAFILVLFVSSLLYAGDGQKKKQAADPNDSTSVDEYPVPTKQVMPKYPEKAKAEGIPEPCM